MTCCPSRRSAIAGVLPRAVIVVLATVGVLGVAALPGVCPAQTMARHHASPGSRPGMVGVGAGETKVGFDHDLQVIANLKASPPAEPVVCLLGGSAARESTVSDDSWAAQVQALGATALTYNLCWAVQTFAQDVWLMEALPSGHLNMIVFIGVNVRRFSSPQTRASFTLPAPVFPLPPWVQHVYGQDQILPVSEKQAEVSAWIVDKYPIFQANYSTSRMMLERLITVCKARGLHPVLMDSPRNMAIIGHALDAPISRYTSTCRALSVKYRIPFLSGFVGAANLANGDFYDLWHIVEPGRVKWQRVLSEKTAELLRLYGLGSAGASVAR